MTRVKESVWRRGGSVISTYFDRVRAFTPNARKYLDTDHPHLPKEDIILCLQRDVVDFALRAERRGDTIEAVPVRAGKAG